MQSRKWQYSCFCTLVIILIFFTAIISMLFHISIFSSIKNLISDCLLISVFWQVFAWCDHKIVFFWSAEQFYDHIMQKLVKTGKNTEVNKQSDVKFWLNWIKFGAVLYSLGCTPKEKHWILNVLVRSMKCMSAINWIR